MIDRRYDSMRPKVVVQRRPSYGHDRIYPVNQTAKDFIRLLGRKVFTADELAVIQGLGFEIEFVPMDIVIGVENE